MEATIRPYRAEDLGKVLQLWERAGGSSADAGSLTVDQAVDLLGSEAAIALVAEIGDELVGLVVASISPPVASIHRITALPDSSVTAKIADRLLEQLESELAESGVRRVGIVIGENADIRDALDRSDYSAPGESTYMQRDVPSSLAVPTALAELPGQMVSPTLWKQLQGLEHAKEIIERRVILPLAEPELAARHAVRPPRAIVLFGPPGTGKTTFAKGIASRLGWPFVEIQPSELAGEGPEGEAKLLAETFDRILALDSAVTFVDEVEDVASSRDDDRRVSSNVTNEFLRLIPPFRQASQHLLVCATNWVGRLDSAFLRPGRFDYVLPVGPPDGAARRAIWQRYTDEITDEEVDLGRLVEASELFTPADIEFAARKAAQRAFEREHFEHGAGRARTEDFLVAIEGSNPTLSAEILATFEDDRERFARY